MKVRCHYFFMVVMETEQQRPRAKIVVKLESHGHMLWKEVTIKISLELMKNLERIIGIDKLLYRMVKI